MRNNKKICHVCKKKMDDTEPRVYSFGNAICGRCVERNKGPCDHITHICIAHGFIRYVSKEILETSSEPFVVENNHCPLCGEKIKKDPPLPMEYLIEDAKRAGIELILRNEE